MNLADRTYRYIRTSPALLAVVVSAFVVLAAVAVVLAIYGDLSGFALLAVAAGFFVGFPPSVAADLSDIAEQCFGGLIPVPATALPALAEFFATRTTSPAFPPPRTAVLA